MDVGYYILWGKAMAKILIVDDAKFMRTLVKDALVPRGHEIIGEAENGVEAVQLYKKLRPDLVTMDITMREKDGIGHTIILLSDVHYGNLVHPKHLGGRGEYNNEIAKNRIAEAEQNKANSLFAGE